MVFTIAEIKSMIMSENPEERRVATRRIWTDWNSFENKSELTNLEERFLTLLKTESEERNIWHLMIVLGLIGSKKAIPLLVDLLTKSDKENVRGFAAEALGRYELGMVDNEIFDILWKLVETDDSLVVKINSIRACTDRYAGSKNKEISVKLLELLKSQSHSAIQTSILVQLGKIGCMEISADLIHILITRRTEVTKKMAGIALDEIAKINDLRDRQDLINLMRKDRL